MDKVEFSADFFIGNRTKLRELFSGTAPIVITANGLLQRNGDTNYQFQQDSSFWYLTGVNNADVILVIDKSKEYLIIPNRSISQITFDGATEQAELTKISGIETIYNETDGWKLLKARLKKVKHAATLAAPPAYIDVYGMYTNPARQNLIRKLKEANENLELLDLRVHLSRLRCIKQPVELEVINKAIEITLQTLKPMTRSIQKQKYAYEYEIEADITKGFRYRGAEGHGFTPIVAAGENATTIHYVANNGKLRSGNLVILDVGAEVGHYSADISRTLAIAKPTNRQKKVHAAVVEAQQFALSLLKPGIVPIEYEEQVENFMGEKLRELGLLKSISKEAVHKYYPHHVSHFLGLDVHDVGDYHIPLEPNMILTCEPGIYIPEEGIGVRIEDDVLITEGGNLVLSKNLPSVLL